MESGNKKAQTMGIWDRERLPLRMDSQFRIIFLYHPPKLTSVKWQIHLYSPCRVVSCFWCLLFE